MRGSWLALIVGAAVGSPFVDVARATPMQATFAGLVTDSDSQFEATFVYDTNDLVPSPANMDWLEARPGTEQRATYRDTTRSFVLLHANRFAIGSYDSIVFEDDGSALTTQVSSYEIATPEGLMNLTFGGVAGTGIFSLGADGLDYANVTPTALTVTTRSAFDGGALAPVSLPPALSLFGCAILFLVIIGAYRRRMSVRLSYASGMKASATPLMQ